MELRSCNMLLSRGQLWWKQELLCRQLSRGGRENVCARGWGGGQNRHQLAA